MHLTRETSRATPRPVRRSGRRAVAWTCIVALTALIVTSACTARRSPSTRVDDAAITAKIKTKIAADPQVNPFEVDVDTSKGVVRLSGTVETSADRAEIVRIAENTRGVVRVVNDIRLGDPSVTEILSDTVIATKVKAKLTADPEINPFRVDVDVVRGVVTLRGEVDDDRTRDEAEKLAWSTRGVRKVENRIELVDESS